MLSKLLPMTDTTPPHADGQIRPLEPSTTSQGVHGLVINH